MTLKLLGIFLALCIPFFIDVAQKDFGTAGKKAQWWIIASVPFVGFIVYLIFGFRKGIKQTGKV